MSASMVEITMMLLSIAIFLNALLLTSSIPYMSRERKRKIIFEIAYSLVWEAERIWGNEMGAIKKAHVKAKLYIAISTMPILRDCVIKEKFVDEVVESAVDKMMEYINESKLRKTPNS